MEIFWICIALLLSVIGSVIPKDNEDKIVMFFVSIVCSLIVALAVYCLAYGKGIKDGAYNQLKGKYEVTYVIDKDSCVVDTIIKIK